VYAPHAARRPVHKLRVYVYDLPWTVSRWAAVYGWQGGVPAVAPYGGGCHCKVLTGYFTAEWCSQRSWCWRCFVVLVL
jgi:hypothetical protein